MEEQRDVLTLVAQGHTAADAAPDRLWEKETVVSLFLKPLSNIRWQEDYWGRVLWGRCFLTIVNHHHPNSSSVRLITIKTSASHLLSFLFATGTLAGPRYICPAGIGGGKTILTCIDAESDGFLKSTQDAVCASLTNPPLSLNVLYLLIDMQSSAASNHTPCTNFSLLRSHSQAKGLFTMLRWQHEGPL